MSIKKKSSKSINSITSPKDSNNNKINKFKTSSPTPSSNNQNKFKKTIKEQEKTKITSFTPEDFYTNALKLQQEIEKNKNSPLEWLHILYDMREIIQDKNNGSKGVHIKELTILNDCFRSIISIFTYNKHVCQDDEDYKVVKNLLESIYDLLVLIFENNKEKNLSSSTSSVSSLSFSPSFTSRKKNSNKIIPSSLFHSLFTNISQCMHSMSPSIAQRNCKHFQSIIQNIKGPIASPPTSPIATSSPPNSSNVICYDSSCPITASFISTYQQKTCRRESDMFFLLLKIINYLVLLDPVSIISYWDIFLVDNYSTENFIRKSFEAIPLIQRPIHFKIYPSSSSSSSSSSPKSSPSISSTSFITSISTHNLEEETVKSLPPLPSFIFSSAEAYQYPLNLTINNSTYSRLNLISKLSFDLLPIQKFSSLIFSLVFTHSNTRMRKEAIQTLVSLINLPSLTSWILHFYQQKKHELQYKSSTFNITSSSKNLSKIKTNNQTINNNSLSSKINKILKKSIYINTILLILESKIEVFQAILSFFSTTINLLPMVLINEQKNLLLSNELISYYNPEIEKIIRLLFLISFEINSSPSETTSSNPHSKFNLPPLIINMINGKDNLKFQFSDRAVACLHWLDSTLKNISTNSSDNDLILSIFQKILTDDDLNEEQKETFSSTEYNDCLLSSPFGEYLKVVEKKHDLTQSKDNYSCILFNIIYLYSYSSKRLNNSQVNPLFHLVFQSIRLILPLLLSPTNNYQNRKSNSILKFLINFLNYLKESSTSSSSTSDLDKELYIKLLGLLYESKEFWIVIGLHDEILRTKETSAIKNDSKQIINKLKNNILFQFISSSSSIVSLLNILYQTFTLTPTSSPLIRLRVLETMSRIDPYLWLLWSNIYIKINKSNELIEISSNDINKNKLNSDNKLISLCHGVLLFLIRCTSDSMGTIRSAAYRVLGNCLSYWSSLEENITDSEDDFYLATPNKDINKKNINNIILDLKSLNNNKNYIKIFLNENTSDNFLTKFLSSQGFQNDLPSFLNFPQSLRLWIELFLKGSNDTKLSVRIQSLWCLSLLTIMHQLQYRCDSSVKLKNNLYHYGILCYNNSYGSLVFDDFDEVINISNDIDTDLLESNNQLNDVEETKIESKYTTPIKEVQLKPREKKNPYIFNFIRYIRYFQENFSSFFEPSIRTSSQFMDTFLASYNDNFTLFSNIIQQELKCLNDSEKIVTTSIRSLGYSLITYGPLLAKNLLNYYSISNGKNQNVDDQLNHILLLHLNVFNSLKSKYNINLDDNGSLSDLEDEVNDSFIMTTVLKLLIKNNTVKLLCSLSQTFLYLFISSFLIQLDYSLIVPNSNAEKKKQKNSLNSFTYMNIFFKTNDFDLSYSDNSTSYLVLNSYQSSNLLLPSLQNNILPILFLISSLSHGPVQLRLLAGRSLLYLILGLPQLQILHTLESINEKNQTNISILYPISIDHVFKIIEASLLLLDDISQTTIASLNETTSIRSAQAVNRERSLNLRFVALVLLLSCLRIATQFASYMNNEKNVEITTDNQKMILRQLIQSILSHGPGLFKLLEDNLSNPISSTLETILSPPPGLRYHKPILPYLEDIQDLSITYGVLTPLIAIEIIQILDDKIPNSLTNIYNYTYFYEEDINTNEKIHVSPLLINHSSKLDYFSQPTSIGEEDDEF